MLLIVVFQRVYIEVILIVITLFSYYLFDQF